MAISLGDQLTIAKGERLAISPDEGLSVSLGRALGDKSRRTVHDSEGPAFGDMPERFPMLGVGLPLAISQRGLA